LDKRIGGLFVMQWLVCISGVYPDTIRIEMQLGGTAGAWTDVSEDWLQRDGVHVSCGIRGSGPLDRVHLPAR
jgi:hypothetical protein